VVAPCATTIAVGFGVGQALAANATVVASGFRFGLTGNPTIPQGGSLDVRNNDPAPHDVTASANGPDGRGLFRSATFGGPGVTKPVAGVQYLRAGDYPFICSVHPFMTGTLHVTSAGQPVARPDIEVTLPAQSLDRVRSTGRLAVRLQARTRANDVVLVARKGRTVVARRTNLDRPAGTTRTLSLALTAAGRRALRGLDRATVTLAGTVPFGAPDTVRRTLR
jgi:hypothetical protein